MFDFIFLFHLVALVFRKVHFVLLLADSVAVLLQLQNHCCLEPGQKMQELTYPETWASRRVQEVEDGRKMRCKNKCIYLYDFNELLDWLTN